MSLRRCHYASLSDGSDTKWLWPHAAHILNSFALTFCCGLVSEYQLYHNNNSDGNVVGISVTVTAFVRIWYIFFFSMYFPKILKLTCKTN